MAGRPISGNRAFSFSTAPALASDWRSYCPAVSIVPVAEAVVSKAANSSLVFHGPANPAVGVPDAVRLNGWMSE